MGWSPVFTDSEDDSDSGSECNSDSDRGMTKEEWRRHEAQVELSDGFEVDWITGCEIGYAQITPRNFDETDETNDCVYYSKIAIEEFNKTPHKDIEGELEFDKVVMAMGTAVDYYLTFDAKNLAKGGEIVTYQSNVFIGIPSTGGKVLSFRLKPLQGSVKNWFWKNEA